MRRSPKKFYHAPHVDEVIALYPACDDHSDADFALYERVHALWDDRHNSPSWWNGVVVSIRRTDSELTNWVNDSLASGDWSIDRNNSMTGLGFKLAQYRSRPDIVIPDHQSFCYLVHWPEQHFDFEPHWYVSPTIQRGWNRNEPVRERHATEVLSGERLPVTLMSPSVSRSSSTSSSPASQTAVSRSLAQPIDSASAGRGRRRPAQRKRKAAWSDDTENANENGNEPASELQSTFTREFLAQFTRDILANPPLMRFEFPTFGN